MRVGGKYSKDIWFWFLSFFPALTVGGRRCMEGRLCNLPHRHPRNNSVHDRGLSGVHGLWWWFCLHLQHCLFEEFKLFLTHLSPSKGLYHRRHPFSWSRDPHPNLCSSIALKSLVINHLPAVKRTLNVSVSAWYTEISDET